MNIMPGFGIAMGGIGGLDAATSAWVEEVVNNGGTVSDARAALVDNLIVGLKADGIWLKLDRLWIFAAEDQPSALTDMVGLTLATSNGATFTADAGYAGEDVANSTKYIDTNFNPSTHGVTYTQNSAHIALWQVTNNLDTTGATALGCAPPGFDPMIVLNIPYTDNNFYARINDSPLSGSQGTPSTRIGHWLLNRSGSSATQFYQDGSSFSSPNASSGALINLDIFVLCMNENGNPRYGTQNQQAMVSFGGSLTSGEVADFYTHLQTYMTAVGL